MHRTWPRSARTRTSTLTATLAVLALTSPLAGCSSSEGDPAPAAEAWTEAQEDLRSAGTGSFTFRLEAAGEPLIQSDGDFRLEPAAGVWSTVTVDEEGARTERFAVDPSRAVTQEDAAEPDCWVAAAAPEPDAVVPGPVRLLLDADDPAWDQGAVGSVVRVSADLSGVLDALGPLVDEVETEAGSRLQLDVMLEGGRVSAWATDLRTVLQAVERNGGTVPEKLDPFLGEDSDFPVLASISGLGDDVDVDVPEPGGGCR